MVGSEKVQKYVDVIKGWSITVRSSRPIVVIWVGVMNCDNFTNFSSRRNRFALLASRSIIPGCKNDGQKLFNLNYGDWEKY